MPNGRWLNVTLCILGFIVLGYFRHLVILHTNVVLGNSSFEFSKERIPGLVYLLKSFPYNLTYLEKVLQVFFLALYAFLSWVLLDALKIPNKSQRKFLILFCILSALSAGFSFIAASLFPSYTILLKSIFVKFQSPLPVIVFYLMWRGKVV